MKKENPVFDEIPPWLTFLLGSATGYTVESKIAKVATFGITTALIYIGAMRKRFSTSMAFGAGEILGTIIQMIGTGGGETGTPSVSGVIRGTIKQYIVAGDKVYVRDVSEAESKIFTGYDKSPQITVEGLNALLKDKSFINSVKEGRIEVEVVFETLSISDKFEGQVKTWMTEFNKVTGKAAVPFTKEKL